MGTEKNSLVKHINIYMEKSLKQKEQLRGYLRDKLQQLSQKQPLVVLHGKQGGVWNAEQE